MTTKNKTTAAQTTLLHAAELLEAEAKALNEFWNNKKNPPEWIGAPKARAAHDDALTTALELRLLAKRIDDGQIAVPQAPTFERTRNGNNLDTKKHVHER